MKRVYVYNFIPMNEIRIHTVTSEKEFQEICNTVHNEPNKYKVISQFDVDDEWETVVNNVIYTLNRIFEALGSVIRFEDRGRYFTKHAIKPVVCVQGDPFINDISVKFNYDFYNKVTSIMSDLCMEASMCIVVEFNWEETILFRRKEDVKTDTM